MHEDRVTVNLVTLQTDMLREKIQRLKDFARTCEMTPWQLMTMQLRNLHHGQRRMCIRQTHLWCRKVFLRSIWMLYMMHRSNNKLAGNRATSTPMLLWSKATLGSFRLVFQNTELRTTRIEVSSQALRPSGFNGKTTFSTWTYQRVYEKDLSKTVPFDSYTSSINFPLLPKEENMVVTARFSTVNQIRLEMEPMMEALKHHEIDGKYEVIEYIESFKSHGQRLAPQTLNRIHAQLVQND